MKRKLFALLVACLMCGAAMATGTVRIERTATLTSEKMVQTMFARSSEMPFSFEIDGVSSKRFIHKWSRRLVAVEATEHNTKRWDLLLTSPDKKLAVRCEIVAYTDFPAVEWTLFLKNNGTQNSAQFTNINAADLTISDNATEGYTLYTAQGCHAIDRDFHLLRTDLECDTTYRHTPMGGRPSSKTAFPFYNVTNSRGDRGVFFSLGWTGNWFAEWQRTDKGVEVSAGMPSVDLFLYPGEEIRSPRVSLLMWQGDSRIDGHNAFRRFVVAHHSPRNSRGELITPPLCAGFDYGDPAPCGEYESFTELLARATIERHRNFGIVPEIFWLDAGWYHGNNAPLSREQGRSWYTTAGSWIADSTRFPRGLRPIADEVHQVGAEFMVWFEPERVYVGSLWEQQLPAEWLLASSKSGKHRLLNIGNPEACDFLCKYMGDFFEENGIDHYRQDFNINPDTFWAEADSVGRKGITEIRYVQGLYRYWDYLRERFPDMLIDNCSSGGRRFDIETISRSIPLWRTDCHYGEPTCQQCHEYGLSQFLPMHGTGIYYADRYCARSGMSSAYAWFGEVFSRRNAIPDLRHLMATYRQLRDYYLEDFYPLSGDGDITGKDKWVAWQFHNPTTNSGIIQAFRRDEAPEVSIVVKLDGVSADVLYDIYNEDNKITVQRTGQQLIEGLKLNLPSPRSSLLLRYSPAE